MPFVPSCLWPWFNLSLLILCHPCGSEHIFPLLFIFFLVEMALYLSSKRNADMGVVSMETHCRQRWCQCCAVSCICLSGCFFFFLLLLFYARETEVCSISWACILTICQAAYIKCVRVRVCDCFPTVWRLLEQKWMSPVEHHGWEGGMYYLVLSLCKY